MSKECLCVESVGRGNGREREREKTADRQTDRIDRQNPPSRHRESKRLELKKKRYAFLVRRQQFEV